MKFIRDRLPALSSRKSDGRRTMNAPASRGSEIGFAIVMFTGIGWLMDREFGTYPTLTVSFLCISFIANMIRVYYAYKHAMERFEEERQRNLDGESSVVPHDDFDSVAGQEESADGGPEVSAPVRSQDAGDASGSAGGGVDGQESSP